MQAVLMYHSLDTSGSPISLAPEAFERHLDWLSTHAETEVCAFSQVAEPARRENRIALTFDDAFANFKTEAWPRLKDRGLHATIFVVSDHVGRTNRWADEKLGSVPELPLLDWDDLAQMAEEGLELGCHTRSHRHLTTLSTDDIEEEIVTCLDAIESYCGVRPQTLAYPYGDYDQKSLSIAEKHVQLACTTEFDLMTPGENTCEIPRIDAWYFAKPGLLESFGSPRFGSFVSRRKILRRLRRALPLFRG